MSSARNSERLQTLLKDRHEHVARFIAAHDRRDGLLKTNPSREVVESLLASGEILASEPGHKDRFLEELEGILREMEVSWKKSGRARRGQILDTLGHVIENWPEETPLSPALQRFLATTIRSTPADETDSIDSPAVLRSWDMLRAYTFRDDLETLESRLTKNGVALKLLVEPLCESALQEKQFSIADEMVRFVMAGSSREAPVDDLLWYAWNVRFRIFEAKDDLAAGRAFLMKVRTICKKRDREDLLTSLDSWEKTFSKPAEEEPSDGPVGKKESISKLKDRALLEAFGIDPETVPEKRLVLAGPAVERGGYILAHRPKASCAVRARYLREQLGWIASAIIEEKEKGTEVLSREIVLRALHTQLVPEAESLTEAVTRTEAAKTVAAIELPKGRKNRLNQAVSNFSSILKELEAGVFGYHPEAGGYPLAKLPAGEIRGPSE